MSYRRQSPQPVVEGGTGAQTLTGVLTGNGTSAVTANAVTQYGTVIAGASNAVTSVAPSSTSGVPLISQGSSSNPVYGTAVVGGGGTGATTFTAYAVLTAGTSSTGAFQNVSGVGTSGQVLTSQGASALPQWATPSSSSTLTITSVAHSASPYTVLSTDQYLSCDSTAGAISILLPNAPTSGRVIYVKDSTAQAATNNITITTVGGTVDIDGATTFVMNTNRQAASCLYNGNSTAYEIF